MENLLDRAPDRAQATDEAVAEIPSAASRTVAFASTGLPSSLPPVPTATQSLAVAGAAESAPSGAAVLIETLLELGVDTVFGYPGGAVLPLYDALHAQPRLRHVLVRHEQAAVHAAEGYARTTGRVGVVFVTSGPGVSNTTTGLLDALSDSVPVLCVSGQVAMSAIGTNAFQECDALGISATVTKWNVQIRDVSQVAALVRQAHATAAGGRPGPVLLDFPKDLQQQPALQSQAAQERSGAARPSAAGATVATAPTSESLRAAVDLIRSAHRPVFYGGGGLINSGPVACELFTRLVRQTGMPCTLTLLGLGAFPASDPAFLGMLGMHGTLEANKAMHDADLIVCVGARFDDRVTGRVDGFAPHARFIHVDIDPASIGKVVRADVALRGDCRAVLQSLLAAWQASEQATAGVAGLERGVLRAWWESIERWRAQRSLAFDDTAPQIAPQALMSRLQQALVGRRPIVATDVGQHQMWACLLYTSPSPRDLSTSRMPSSA